ncbi:helix-turn-helix-domain containing type [Fusarium albosuccineum]|uniref:Helix-turn-helix-domain containing type n=1 Tax=Fusarium albosuccineum TaxID=1237068 RepID=A0A8H4PDS7_9HYPO|nr:helix-turn-helix-domain containing type [Fusarium albosuccineum]
MPGTSLYDLIIPTFTKGLQTYDHILGKAEEFAKEKGLNADEVFPQARLVEDQLPLTFQVQNTTKAIQTTVGRLTGVEPTFFENNEKTIAELRQRIQKTLDLLKTVKPEDVNSREDTLIELPWAGQTRKVTVKAAVLGHGQTNFFFHLVTGYSILRAKGVPVGKADYLTSFLGFDDYAHRAKI